MQRTYKDVLDDIYSGPRADSDETENFRPSQRHTHEYEGSVKIAEKPNDPHNHRFAGVTGQAIPIHNGRHFHKLEDNTDFYVDHFHIVADKTGPSIPVGNGRHVHFVEGQTTVNDGHQHDFQFATLIDNPIGAWPTCE